MIRAATPAATPTIEITVINEMTACLRFALRYRIATSSSNFIPPSDVETESHPLARSSSSATSSTGRRQFPRLRSEACRSSKHGCNLHPSDVLLHHRDPVRLIAPEIARADP